MAMPVGTVGSYAIGVVPGTGSANAEDVYNVITNIAPYETVFMSSAPQTTARAVLHEWLTDSLPALSTLGAIEGDNWSAASYGGYTSRSRLNNITQIFRRDFAVANTQNDMNNPIGVDREYAYQATLNMRAVKRNMEFTFLYRDGTGAIGATDTVRYAYNIRGMHDRGTGYAMPRTAISGAITLAHVNTAGETLKLYGAQPDTIMLPLGNKKDLTQSIMYNPAPAYPASGGGTAYNQSPLSKYTGNITLIETDSGVYAVVPNILMGQSAQASSSCFGFMYERSKLRIAWGRQLQHKDLPPNGDHVRGYIVGEATLEVLHPSCVYLFDYITTTLENKS